MSEAVRQSRKKRSILGTEGSGEWAKIPHCSSKFDIKNLCLGWDVGAAIRFLASDEASWITGVILPVDAGATAAVGLGHNMGH